MNSLQWLLHDGQTLVPLLTLHRFRSPWSSAKSVRSRIGQERLYRRRGQESLIQIELGGASPIRLNHIAAAGRSANCVAGMMSLEQRVAVAPISNRERAAQCCGNINFIQP